MPVHSSMAKLQDLLSNFLCHEVISFLIYGTALLLVLLYLPYWVRHQLDRHYLKLLAVKAKERHMNQQMEYPEQNPGIDCLDPGIMKEEDDDDNHDCDNDEGQGDRKTEMESANVLEKESDEKLSYMSPVTSGIAH